ncbi:MAG: hypothetical protein R3322_00440 [Kiloniellales bacterium]|nr:hypothetical protein [Kiloniellales bacterium]
MGMKPRVKPRMAATAENRMRVELGLTQSQYAQICDSLEVLYGYYESLDLNPKDFWKDQDSVRETMVEAYGEEEWDILLFEIGVFEGVSRSHGFSPERVFSAHVKEREEDAAEAA